MKQLSIRGTRAVWRQTLLLNAETRADVSPSSSIFERTNLLFMSESTPLKDIVHNFQRGHNGEQQIGWSHNETSPAVLNCFFCSTRPLKAKLKAYIPHVDSISANSPTNQIQLPVYITSKGQNLF